MHIYHIYFDNHHAGKYERFPCYGLCIYQNPTKPDCVQYSCRFRDDREKSNGYYIASPITTKEKKSPPPYGLRIYQGLRNLILNRTFCEFSLHHPVSRNLLEWFEDTLIADESFFQTLIRVRVDKAPLKIIRQSQEMSNHWERKQNNRTFLVTQDNTVKIQESREVARYSHWMRNRKTEGECEGKWIRGICNYSLFALPSLLANRTELFLNKFSIDVDASAVGCMLEHVLGRDRFKIVTKE